MTKNLIFIISAVLFISIVLSSSKSQAAVGLPKDYIPKNLPNADAPEQLTSYSAVQQKLAGLISPLLEIAGGISIFFVVLGGFMWITAMGKQEQLEKGKKILTWAIIGFTVIILSYAIVQAIVSTMFEEIPKDDAPPANS